MRAPGCRCGRISSSGAAVQREQRGLRQRPAEPRGGQAEGGRRRARRASRRGVDAAREQRRRRRSGTDRRRPARRPGRPRCAEHLARRRRRTGSARAAPRRGSAAPASARWRLPPNTISAARDRARARPALKPVDAVLADADDGQPAARCGSLARDRLRQTPCDAFSFSAAPTEARQLAERLARPRRSRRSRCRWPAAPPRPARQPVPVRIGGFGGAEGLADYLADERIDVLIDATHPYAATISANAAQPRASAGVPLARAAAAALDGGRRRPLDRGRRRRRRGRARSGERRAASSSRSAARSSAPSRPRRSIIISSAASIRSSRRSPCRTPTYIVGARAVRRGRRARAAARARHRRRRRQEQRRRRDLRQDRGGARARPRR